MSGWKKSVALFLCLALLGGCAPSDGARSDAGEAGADAGSGVEKVPDDYEVKYIDLKQEEKEEIRQQVSSVMDECADIYAAAAGGNNRDAVLEEEIVHHMAETAAAEGIAVTCGNMIIIC